MDGGLGLDVDFIAGELGGQAGVLPLLADGQGELVIRHGHPAALGTFQGLDRELDLSMYTSGADPISFMPEKYGWTGKVAGVRGAG